MTSAHIIWIPVAGKVEEKFMRNAVLCVAALSLSAIAAPAMAQDPELKINSSVPYYCQTISGFPESSAVQLGSIVQPNGQLVNAFAGGPATTTFATTGNYYCNTAAEIELTATPLLRLNPTGVIDPDFTERVDYTATLDWAGVSAVATSASNATTEVESTQARTGVLSVVVSTPTVDAGVRPVAGTYEGSVTVTFTAKA